MSHEMRKGNQRKSLLDRTQDAHPADESHYLMWLMVNRLAQLTDFSITSFVFLVFSIDRLWNYALRAHTHTHTHLSLIHI